MVKFMVMLDWPTLEMIVKKISYKDWTLILGDENGVPYLQWKFQAPEYAIADTKPETWYSRKWMLTGLDATEVVRTAFKAARNAELHECEEAFKFSGATIYSPHHNLYDLLALARKEF